MTYVCTGCGHTTDDPARDLVNLRRNRKISCCPERKMVDPQQEILDMLALLCDGMKRLERSICRPHYDRETFHQVQECKERREQVEKRILAISKPRR